MLTNSPGGFRPIGRATTATQPHKCPNTSAGTTFAASRPSRTLPTVTNGKPLPGIKPPRPRKSIPLPIHQEVVWGHDPPGNATSVSGRGSFLDHIPPGLTSIFQSRWREYRKLFRWRRPNKTVQHGSSRIVDSVGAFTSLHDTHLSDLFILVRSAHHGQRLTSPRLKSEPGSKSSTF